MSRFHHGHGDRTQPRREEPAIDVTITPDVGPRNTIWHRKIVESARLPNTKTGNIVRLDCGHTVMTFGDLSRACGIVLCDQCREQFVMSDAQMNEPGFWMYETTGVLRPAVERYLEGESLSDADIAALRAYIRQWIFADVWKGVDELRNAVDGLTTREAIDEWTERALDLAIDPW
jgi:hypothetical protein